AQVHSAAILADSISQLPFPRPWTITWGHWPPSHRNTLLGRHTVGVDSVAAATLDGIPVAVSGSEDGTVRVWDLRTGAALGKPLTGHAGPVNAVAVGKVSGIPVAVSSNSDRSVRVWDLRTGAALGKPLVRRPVRIRRRWYF